MNSNSRGFGLIGLIAFLFIFGMTTSVGWKIYNTRTVIHNAPAIETTLKAPNPQPKPVDNLHVALLPSISTTGWHAFQEDGGKISYFYPSDWAFKNNGAYYYQATSATTFATSDNRGIFQTITTPIGNTHADYTKDYKILTGAQITVRVTDLHTGNVAQAPFDYCQTQPDLLLEKLDNSATPVCVKMSYGSSLYDIGASYCSLQLSAGIILGSKNTIEQNQKYLQVLVGIGKTWNFKNVCTTDSQNVEHLYFGP